MFGCCVAGRLLQTNLQQIDETHCTFALESAETINHLCVFMLGTVPFPPGYAATVHFYWPDKGIQLLGMLSNDKPSAIFRVRGSFGTSKPSHATHQLLIASTQSSGTTAQLGIAIEPIEVVMNQVSSLPPPNKPVTDPSTLAEKIGKHLVNYLSGFGEVAPGGQMYVPMSAVTRWYDNFVGKIKSVGISFLERQD